jgi:putative transposase
MFYDPDKHHRRSIRLKGYDYSGPGAYYITLCTQERQCLFGEILKGKMRLNEMGHSVAYTWNDLPNHYPVTLDACVVMPNHLHGILVLGTDVGAELKSAPTEQQATRPGLGEMIRALKTFSTRRINELQRRPGIQIWQRGYYERIIRNDLEMNRIRRYIQENPAQWERDAGNPKQERP